MSRKDTPNGPTRWPFVDAARIGGVGNDDWTALRGFSALIGLFMALLVGVVSLVFGHYEIVGKENNFKADVYEFSSVTRQLLQTFDYVAIHSAAEVFQQSNSIPELYVEDSYGYAVYGSKENFDGLAYEDITLTTSEQEALEFLGTIWIAERNDLMGIVLLRSALISIAAFLIAWLTARGLMYYYIKTYVAAPIAELTSAMTETVATGKLVQSRYFGDTQLGRLAAQFNDMQAHLKETRESLNASFTALQQEKLERQSQLEGLGDVLHATGQNVSFYTADCKLRHSTAGLDTNTAISAFLRRDQLALKGPESFFRKTDFDVTVIETDSQEHSEIQFALEVENWPQGIWAFSCLKLATGEYALICTDITEARKSERAMVHRQKMDAVGELTSGIAHEIKNVLAIISGSLELSMKEFDASGAVAHHLATAQNGCNRASAVIGKLLNFSRESEMIEKTQELRPNLETLQSMIQNLLGPHIAFEIDVEENLFLALDWQKLESMLINLVINARDAINARAHISRRGKVTISAHAAPAERLQELQLPVDKPYVLLSISDDGCGMKPAVRSRIFEPFFSTKKRGQGTGLGLSEVYGFVEQCGGQITCQSEPDIGTSFEIVLPMAQSFARKLVDPAVTSVTERLKPMASNALCLIVDDEKALVDIIRKALESRGYTVLTALTVAAGKEVLIQHGTKLDFLLCDYYLTDGLGTELLKMALKTYPNIKRLLMTGNITDVNKTEGLAQHYLDKPFSMVDLLKVMTEMEHIHEG